jgi:MFS family permease
METDNVMHENAIKQEKIELTDEAFGYLNEIRKWTTFFSILGFIGIVLMVIFGLFAGLIFSKLGYKNMYFPSTLFGVIYLFFGIVYLLPVLYLFKFSMHAKKAIKMQHQQSISNAFKNMKSHFKFMGILTIIFLSLYIFSGFIFLITRAFI